MPLHRGLFEDYVANFWCATHAFIKWKRLLSQVSLVRACTAATLLALTPSCTHQIMRPSRLGLLYCMLNSSLAFFLFSYQVFFLLGLRLFAAVNDAAVDHHDVHCSLRGCAPQHPLRQHYLCATHRVWVHEHMFAVRVEAQL